LRCWSISRPDIGTVDAFKRALLDAKSITYLKEGASTIYLDRLFTRLGIAEALRAKTVKPDTETVSERVAQGEVELGIIVIPNILSVPGAELVGPRTRPHFRPGSCGRCSPRFSRR
jgi:molybdate transport system substrate-binding protein